VKLTTLDRDKKTFFAIPRDEIDEHLLDQVGFLQCLGKRLARNGRAECDLCAFPACRGPEGSGYFRTTDELKAVQFVKYADERAMATLSVNEKLRPLIEWYKKNPPPDGWVKPTSPLFLEEY
jgi:hypothetical protein